MNSHPSTLPWILAPIALFVVVIIWMILNARKRTQDLAAAAPQIGFTFMGDTWRGPVLNPQHKTCLLQRTRGSFKNAMVGSAGSLQAIIFDYTYRMGRSTVTQTLACFSDKPQFPPFALKPEGIFDRLGDAIVHTDINFDSHPGFSRRYALKSPDEAGTRRLFTSSLLSYMEQIPSGRNWNIETSGTNLFIYRAGRTVSPADLSTFFHETSSIATTVFNSDGLKNPVG
ncbi:MAG: hypothetical protein LAP86_05800 [Acidobacteriia bacterium]|nr:hypothetical protein [Terriglobia bacterium]